MKITNYIFNSNAIKKKANVQIKVILNATNVASDNTYIFHM